MENIIPGNKARTCVSNADCTTSVSVENVIQCSKIGGILR